MSTWVIQSNLLANSQQVPWVDACQELKIPFTDVAVIPFSEEPLEVKVYNKVDSRDNLLIPYGSTRLVKYAKKMRWKGLFFNEENFKTSEWQKNRDDLVNQDAWVTNLKAAMNYMQVFKDDTFFVRPNNDLKSFPGTIIKGEDFTKWIDGATHGGVTFEEAQEVVIGFVQDVQAEWRYFVCDHRIIDGSLYKVRGQIYTEHVEEHDVLKEAQKFAEAWLPDDVVCMDLGLVNGKMKLLEFNCFNCAGTYRHDIKKIVRVVTDYINSHDHK